MTAFFLNFSLILRLFLPMSLQKLFSSFLRKKFFGYVPKSKFLKEDVPKISFGKGSGENGCRLDFRI